MTKTREDRDVLAIHFERFFATLPYHTISNSIMSTTQAPMSSDGLIKNGYYQHGTPPPSDGDEDQTWRITDFGNVRELSRDGSIHATDEVFNAASHLVALILSVLGSAILVVDASAQGEPWKIVSFSLYGASLMFLFGASTLHHAIEGSCEPFLRMLDYFAIYPLIAGTFTPLCLVYYHNQPVGWTFFATIWGLSIIGMLITASCFVKVPKWFSMTLYMSLGWLGACFAFWVSNKMAHVYLNFVSIKTKALMLCVVVVSLSALSRHGSWRHFFPCFWRGLVHCRWIRICYRTAQPVSVALQQHDFFFCDIGA